MQKEKAGAEIFVFPPKQSITSIVRDQRQNYAQKDRALSWRKAMLKAGNALEERARAIEGLLPQGHEAMDYVADLAKISAYLVSCAQDPGRE